MTFQIRDVVLRSPVTSAPDDSVAVAELRLIASNATDVYLIDDHERLLGVVPDYEFLKHRLRGGSPDEPVRNLMSPVGIWLQPACSLDSAALLLRENIRASIPIVEGGRLIGQLCRGNLLRILAESSTAGPVLQDEAVRGAAPPPHFVKFAQAGQVLTSAESE